VGGAKVEAEDVGTTEVMPEEEDLVEEAEVEVEAEEAVDHQPLTPMTHARATLQRIGGP